jgi:SWI/SNF related-matrix-associated actin-dependent regulator of chromatin subfamily C
VLLDTPRGLQSLHPGTRPPTHPNAPGVNGAVKPQPSATPASLELRSSIYQTTAKASKTLSPSEAAALTNGASGELNGLPAEVKHQCDTCGTDCTPVRYHSLKVRDFELCPPCYLDGRFPSSMFSGDFVKLTQAAAANGVHHGGGTDTDDDWTDQEVLLLLEGVEMYDDDWSEIERHVGSRSAQQCIRKFLQLPIEDPYIATEGNMGPLRYARVPFEQADNPVMSVVAFLAGVVGPGVAAEAAKTALYELTDGDKKETTEESVTSAGGEKAEEAKEVTDAGKSEGRVEDQMQEDVPKETEDVSAGSGNKVASPQTAPEAMAVDGEVSSGTQEPTRTIPHSKAVRAANLALKSSAKAARELAEVEDQHIRSMLATIIKLTLTKLELKMSQFEELEELLEEERKGLESARMSLVNERLGLKRMLDNVKGELAKNQAGTATPGALAEAANQAQDALIAASATRIAEVQDVPMEGDSGPVDTPVIANLG